MDTTTQKNLNIRDMKKSNMNNINSFLETNKISIKINGRVCHHRIRVLYALTEQFNLKNYIEIGVHNGSSMAYVIQSNKNKICFGIDPFETLITTDKKMIHYRNNDTINEKKTFTNIISNNIHNSKIKLIKKMSSNVTNNDLGQTTFDLLFIDGDHHYNSVLNDYNKYFEYINKGGFIVFDDLHQEGPNKAYNYILKNDNRVKEFGIYEKTEGILIKK